MPYLASRRSIRSKINVPFGGILYVFLLVGYCLTERNPFHLAYRNQSNSGLLNDEQTLTILHDITDILKAAHIALLPTSARDTFRDLCMLVLVRHAPGLLQFWEEFFLSSGI